MIRIPKYQSLGQYLKYTKLYRLPSWLYRKLIYSNIKATDSCHVHMRLGHKIELKPGAPYLKRVVINRSYNDDNVFFLSPFLKNNPIILDIGANIGLYTCAYTQYYQKLSPTVYAIEAVSSNFEQLLKNIQLNHFGSIKPFRLALGEKEGELTFNLPSKDYQGNAVGSNVLSETDLNRGKSLNSYQEKVPLTTLDIWSDAHNISRCDFMKIDIEGAELAVLKGGVNFIKKTTPVIQCEFNRYFVEGQNLTIDDYHSWAIQHDYECFVEEKDAFIPLDPRNFDYYLVDLLLIPKVKLSSFQEKR